MTTNTKNEKIFKEKIFGDKKMFTKVCDIPSPEEIKQIVPLSKELLEVKLKRDEEIKKIISGEDDRKLLIVGPCSADNEVAVVDYICRLAKVSEKVKEKICIVPRIYTNKPRTKGEGYKGILHNPDPNKKVTDIVHGILAIRSMHVKAMQETGLSGADEMLYPENVPYCDDLISYHAVGARSSENQQHRLVASGLDQAVGVKNPMNGSMEVTLNSIYAAQIPNEFGYRSAQVKTSGNKYAHAILRGSVNVHGNNLQNYHYEDVLRFINMYEEKGLSNPAIIIDTNHSNSDKKPMEQIRIAREIFTNMTYCDKMKKYVKGLLIESYIEDGNQPIGGGVYGKSITDGCLGWQKTESLIYDLADRL